MFSLGFELGTFTSNRGKESAVHNWMDNDFSFIHLSRNTTCWKNTLKNLFFLEFESATFTSNRGKESTVHDWIDSDFSFVHLSRNTTCWKNTLKICFLWDSNLIRLHQIEAKKVLYTIESIMVLHFYVPDRTHFHFVVKISLFSKCVQATTEFTSCRCTIVQN